MCYKYYKFIVVHIQFQFFFKPTQYTLHTCHFFALSFDFILVDDLSNVIL